MSIEQKMQAEDESSLRYRVLNCAKEFKTSWIELGQALYSVSKDKMFKEWGFNTFEAYISRELGIRKGTAMKLLRSYYFLEKEEPQYLESGYAQEAEAVSVPTYEAIDVLRKAKNNKELDAQDYARLKKEIFEEGRDVKEVRKELTALIRERKEPDPDQARQQRRLATVKRFLSVLKSLKQEISIAKLVPEKIVKEADDLIKNIESEINL